MSSRARTAAFRLVTVLVTTLGLLFSPSGAWASHKPIALAAAEAARHAVPAAGVEEHSHAHDDGEADERKPGHSHGHDPADHPHETPNTPPHLAAVIPPLARGWRSYPPAFAVLEAGFRIERPPRPISTP